MQTTTGTSTTTLAAGDEYDVSGLENASFHNQIANTVNSPTTYTGNGNVYFSFDALLAPVPEPSTYAMFFSGLGLLVLVSRFRRKLTV